MRIGKLGVSVVVFLCWLAPLVVAADAVPLRQVLERTGAHLAWDSYRDVGMLSQGTTVVNFAPGRTTAVLNGSENLYLGDVRMEENGEVYFSEDAVTRLEEVFAPPERDGEGRQVTAIFIDPGHGGKDPGTIGKHNVDGETVEVQEKDIVLQVGKRLAELLSERYPHKEVLLSRERDEYLTLEERTERANEIEVDENEAIVYLSLHANASLNRNARGFEVWYLPPEYRRDNLIEARTAGVEDPGVLNILNTIREEELTIESVLLARHIVSALEGRVGEVSPSRGIKEESWYVVRNAKMPSVLVELGFVTNREEMLRLRDQDYLNKLAEAIYTGMHTFITSFEE
ncbi:MAG: N-acetylmuramoyl-L-alanine amidase [Spirochaetaceae bacterium]